MTAIIGIGSLVLSIGAFVYAFANYRRFHRDHTQTFTEKYFHNIPTNDHPAVLGCLWNGGGISTAEIKATLMHLTDLKAISLERIDSDPIDTADVTVPDTKSNANFTGDDYLVIRNNATAPRLLDPIDVQAMSMLFDDLAPFAGGSKTNYDNQLSLSSLSFIAEQNLPQYRQAISKWGAVVQNTADERGFFSYENTNHRETIVGLGILILVVGGSAAMFATNEPSPFWTTVLITAAASAVGCFVLSTKMKPYPAEATAIKAKLAALRTWLTNISEQGNSMPEDAPPWNKLLVMAVILGVSNEVVEHLKATAPQVLSDDAVAPVYAWLHTDIGTASAGSIVDATFEAMKVDY